MTGGKKYRVRYDRIVVLVLAIAFVAIVASSCYKALSASDSKENSEVSDSVSDNTEPTEAPEEEETEAPTDAPSEAAPPVNTVDFDKEASMRGDLVLVNTDHEYTFPNGDVEPITIVGNRNDCYQAGDYTTQLDKNVIIRLNALMAAYAEAMGSSSTDVFVQDGYRTYEAQVERHNSGKSTTFEAGHSDYHTGRTFDMFRYDSTSATGFSFFDTDEWFSENVGKYGFILRYPEGKQDKTGEKPRTYTYRYVGVPHAYYINANGLCLEEYIETVKGYTNEKPLVIDTEGHSYNVYYVKANESGKTAVPVPADKPYAVSGDNDGGFIVTVALS